MVKKKIEGWDGLHEKQHQLYEFLLAAKGDNALTLDNMRQNLEVSSLNTVVHHLKQLEKKGYIRRQGDYGPIEVLPAPIRDIVYLTLYGTVGCSPEGFFNDDNVVDRIPFPARQLRVNSDTFLVEARGDSMEPLIRDQDLVLVDRNPVSSGDIAVVVHRESAKLKKLYKEKGQIILQSLNTKYDPIVVRPDEIRAVGTVRGVVRNFNIDLNIKKSRQQ